MAQYQAFSPGIKVNGNTVLSVVNSISAGSETRKEILSNHGIVDPQGDEWYDQQAWLDAFREIGEEIGPNTLFNIGKSIPEHAAFPPEIDCLEKALSAIDIAYKMNHTKGDIGYYKLVSYDRENRKAVMECKNPYPSEFDRGIITTMLRRFKPADSYKQSVVLDESQPSRVDGADSCTYLVSW